LLADLWLIHDVRSAKLDQLFHIVLDQLSRSAQLSRLNIPNWKSYMMLNPLIKSVNILIFGKSSESVQCAITGPFLRMRHRPSA